eukprot:Gb_30195 [translate_table: standard]
MEILIYSFKGTMELYECFQWLEEYFDYANIQNERDKTLTAALHLTGQAYAWVRRNYEYWTPSLERKALELEYEEEAWGVEDDDSEFETVNVEFKVGKYMEEKTSKEKLEEEQLEYILDKKEENNKEDKNYDLKGKNELDKRAHYIIGYRKNKIEDVRKSAAFDVVERLTRRRVTLDSFARSQTLFIDSHWLGFQDHKQKIFDYRFGCNEASQHLFPTFWNCIQSLSSWFLVFPCYCCIASTRRTNNQWFIELCVHHRSNDENTHLIKFTDGQNTLPSLESSYLPRSRCFNFPYHRGITRSSQSHPLSSSTKNWNIYSRICCAASCMTPLRLLLPSSSSQIFCFAGVKLWQPNSKFPASMSSARLPTPKTSLKSHGFHCHAICREPPREGMSFHIRPSTRFSLALKCRLPSRRVVSFTAELVCHSIRPPRHSIHPKSSHHSCREKKKKGTV